MCIETIINSKIGKGNKEQIKDKLIKGYLATFFFDQFGFEGTKNLPMKLELMFPN